MSQKIPIPPIQPAIDPKHLGMLEDAKNEMIRLTSLDVMRHGMGVVRYVPKKYPLFARPTYVQHVPAHKIFKPYPWYRRVWDKVKGFFN